MPRTCGMSFSAALCRGLIEAVNGVGDRGGDHSFSAALCRGLIEATGQEMWMAEELRSFPRLYAAASLKLSGSEDAESILITVFRGFMPRPH